MSVLVCIVEKDRVIVGCDTRASNNRGYYRDGINYARKAVKVNSNTILAVAGNALLLDLMYNELSKRTYIDRNILVREVVPELLKEQKKYNIDCEGLDGEFIIAQDNRAYAIRNCVYSINDYEAVGAAEREALSSLKTTEKMRLTPETKIYYAINSAARFNCFISDEVYIGDTNGKDFRKFTMKEDYK